MTKDRGSTSPTTPFESEWRKIGARRYGVYAVPTALPSWVPRWLNGDFASAVLASVLYSRADHPPYSARLYWRKDVFYNLGAPWHLVVDEQFDRMGQAKARARELVAELRDGRVPHVETPPQDTTDS